MEAATAAAAAAVAEAVAVQQMRHGAQEQICTLAAFSTVHSADLRVVTNVHETATWWSVKVRNGAGCVPTPPLPLPAKDSGIIDPTPTKC